MNEVVFISGAMTTYYYAIKGDYVAALAVSGIGLTVQKIGEYCHSRGVEGIGEALFCGSFMSAPSLLAGKTLYAVTDSLLISVVGGVIATHKIFNWMSP